MPHLQLPPAAREPTRRKGHGQRRRSTSRPVLPSTGATSRTTTHAIRLRRTNAWLCAVMQETSHHEGRLCGCILLVGIIWALVVLVCDLGFRGNKQAWCCGEMVHKRRRRSSCNFAMCRKRGRAVSLYVLPTRHVPWFFVMEESAYTMPESVPARQNMVQDALCPGYVTIGRESARLDLEQVRTADLRMRQSSYQVVSSACLKTADNLPDRIGFPDLRETTWFYLTDRQG